MAKSVGIVAEYNPFHLGHKYQIDFLHSLGYETVVAAMSGSCVQRGTPAMLDKFTRAEMALNSGVSLVAEIPFPYSSLSAQKYARAGIRVLKSLGVDAISFGSESTDLKAIKNIAEFLLSDKFQISVKAKLDENIPYAQARRAVIQDEFGVGNELLTASNDILAIEYVRACIEENWSPEIIPVKRKGARHNRKDLSLGIVSAGRIRNMVSEYRYETAAEYLPEENRKIFIKNLERGNYFSPDNSFEKALIHTLRQMAPEDFEKITDCNFELSHSFEHACHTSNTFKELYDKLPTKQYTRSRFDRIMLMRFLGADNFPEDLPYIRILGFTEKGRYFLKNTSSTCSLPLSHSPKILSKKNNDCDKVTGLESRARDMQSLFFKISGQPGSDFTTKLIKL